MMKEMLDTGRLLTAILLLAMGLLLDGAVPLVAQDKKASPAFDSRQHARYWKSTRSDDRYLKFASTGIHVYDSGRLRVLGISRIDGDTLFLVDRGRSRTWKASETGDTLRIGESSDTEVFVTTIDYPTAIDLAPLYLAPHRALPTDTIAEIQRELITRFQNDQMARTRLTPEFNKWISEQITGRVLSDKDLSIDSLIPRVQTILEDSSFIEQLKDRYILEITNSFESDSGSYFLASLLGVDSDNVSYIRALLSRIGWIDVHRFGVEASVAACMLVHHSSDLQLMLTVIHEVDKDRTHERINEIYSLMYYRLRLFHGADQEELSRIRLDYGIK
jgi:hypothetical protein